MKEEMLAYLDRSIAWCSQEQLRLKSEYRADEAAHMQIAMNVYSIFLSTYRAMKFDLSETVRRFSGIVSSWDESHQRAHDHGDAQKLLIEEIKLARATEILRKAKELEAVS